jgi:diaminobutyrate-2-oxoglutarate transaminase
MVQSPPPEALHFAEAPRVEEVPGPNSRRLRERQARVESDAVLYPTEVPIAFEEGRGATLRDVDGNLYLDFFAGIGVLNVGHSNPYVTEAVEEQTRRLSHTLDFPTEARLDLVEKLSDIAPGGLSGDCTVVFGGPTGSDAVEASIKLVKQYTGDSGLIAFRGSFHGETAGAFSLTADTEQKSAYAPMLPDVEHVTYPYPFGQDRAPEATVEAALADTEALLAGRYGGLSNPAGVWVEPIQCEGGIVVPPEGFLSGLRELTAEHDVPLVVDEVQTGMGRTGRWFASEWEGVAPDVMPLAKGLGAGLPLSATVYREEMDTWGPGGHTGTFRGYVPAMRAALRAIEYVEDHDLLARTRRLGGYLTDRLEELADRHAAVGDVRGRGLCLGVEFVDADRSAPELVSAVRTACYERGLLVWTGGRNSDVLRLQPPLVVTREQAETGMDILADALAAVTRAGP